MVTGALLAAAVVARTPWPVVGMLALGLWQPAVGLLGLAAVAVTLSARHRKEHLDDEAVWCGAMAAELRAGGSLRAAVEAASARTPDLGLGAVGRMARAGVAIDRLSEQIASRLPRMGVLVGPALRLAAEAGGAAASVFGRLAVRSLEEMEAERQRHVATAQARLSAWVIGALPVIVVAGLGFTGRLGGLVASGPVGVVALAIGIALQLCGFALVWMLSRRAAR